MKDLGAIDLTGIARQPFGQRRRNKQFDFPLSEAEFWALDRSAAQRGAG